MGFNQFLTYLKPSVGGIMENKITLNKTGYIDGGVDFLDPIKGHCYKETEVMALQILLSILHADANFSHLDFGHFNVAFFDKLAEENSGDFFYIQRVDIRIKNGGGKYEYIFIVLVQNGNNPPRIKGYSKPTAVYQLEAGWMSDPSQWLLWNK